MTALTTVISFFTISAVLSLMGKKRSTPAEPGPSRERRNKQRADPEEQAVPEVRAKRRNDSRRAPAVQATQPPVEDMGNFLVRSVAFEASVEEHLFDEFAILSQLMKRKWGPIFYGDSQADEGRARAFYVRIRNPQYQPLGFDLIVGGKRFQFGVEQIAGVLGVPQGEVQIDEKELDKSQARDMRTRFLCGRVAPWRRDAGLNSSNLTTEYRVLHRICTHNVYPRLKNRTECSRYMVEFLYQVGQGADVCLPSIVLHQIVKAARATRKDVCLPFGRLVCQLAQLYGVGGSDGHLVPTQLLGDEMLNNMKIGPKQRQAHIDQYGDADEGEEEESDERDDDENETEDEGEAVGAERAEEIEEVGREPLTIHDIRERLDALKSEVAEIKESQARIEANQAKQEKWNKKMYRAIKALICCSKGEEAPPLSPDSDE